MGLFQLPWKTITQEALHRTLPVVNFLCCLHLTNTYICTPALVLGPSMVPTLSLTGNLVLADRIAARRGRVGRGDVVLLRSPDNPRKVITKRVVGVGGDPVEYVDEIGRERSVVVREGCVWVQGDNAADSTDSRSFGDVPYGLVLGRVFVKIWPFEEFGPLDSKA